MTFIELKAALEAEGLTVSYLIDPNKLTPGYQSEADYRTDPSTMLLVSSPGTTDEYRVKMNPKGAFRLNQRILAADGIYDQISCPLKPQELAERMQPAQARQVA